jgi:hypothetical protein
MPGLFPNYGERYRHGERISTGFVEATVNQVISKRFCKKQQMGWTPRGAHLLLQIRTRVLNGEWEAPFREWYPGFHAAPQPMAACPPRIKRSPCRTSKRCGVVCGRRFCYVDVSCLVFSDR